MVQQGLQRLKDQRNELLLIELVVSHITGLERCGLIVKDQRFGLSMASTNIGKLMARYYVSFETIKVFRKVQGNESFLDIFNTIIRSKEFSEFTLRVSDKKILNTINNHPIRFPIKGKVKTNENKISCLVQAVFDNITIQDPSMQQDAQRMIRIGEKLSKCLAEYIRLSEGLLCGKTYKAHSSALIIAKCYKARLWYNTEFVSKQLKNIGPVYSNHLVNAGKTTIKSLLETDARKIEMILGKAPPFGDQILEAVSAFPQYTINFVRTTQHFFKISIRQTNHRFCYEGQNSCAIVGDANNNLLFYHPKVDQTICEEKAFERTFSLKDESTKFVELKLIHECLVGVDQLEKLILNPDEDLPEPKPKRAKVQTKIKLKSNKQTPLTSNGKPYLHEFLLDDDDYFKEVDVKELDPSESAIPSDPVLSETSFVDEVADQPLERSIKNAFKSFEYIPSSKIPHNNIKDSKRINNHYPHSSQLMETTHDVHVEENLLEEREQQLPFESPTDNPIVVPFEDIPNNGIIEDLLAHNFRLEEAFLKSQMSKIDSPKETRVDNSNTNQEAPLDLSIKKYVLQNATKDLNTTYCVRTPQNSNMSEGPSTFLCTQTNLLSHKSISHPANNDEQKISGNSLTSQACVSNAIRCVPKPMEHKGTQPNKPVRQNSQNGSLKKDFLSRDDSKVASNKIKTNTQNEFRGRPNLSKLKHFSWMFTPPVRKSTKNEEIWKKYSKSCSLPSKKFSFDSASKLSNSHGSEKSTKSENGVHRKTSDTLANNFSSIFNGSKLSQKIIKKRHEDIILSQICQNYVPNRKTNNQTNALLKKLEQELYSESDIDAAKEDNRMNKFFKETYSSQRTPPEQRFDIKAHAEKIFQFRSSFAQPTFQKVLPIKPDNLQQHRMPHCQPSKFPTNPENDRIDEILQNVIQEPLHRLATEINNPYRMKLPRKHKTLDLRNRPRQNFEYFEIMKRKAELEKLNTCIAPNDRNEAYVSQMSKILFADFKESTFPRGSTSIKTESLPKPDFELIEREKKRRMLLMRRGPTIIPAVESIAEFRPVFNVNPDLAETKTEGFVQTFSNFNNSGNAKLSAFNFENTTQKIENNFFDTDAFSDFPKSTGLSNFHSYYKDESVGSDDMGFHFDMNEYQPAATVISTASEFMSPSKMRAKCSIEFENFDNDPGIKEEPLSPCFEALSLLDDNDGEDALLSQLKLEPTQPFSEGFIDLTIPTSSQTSCSLKDMEL